MPEKSGPSEERLIIKFDAGQPIELTGLSDSFAALARMYERHYRKDLEPPPKLYITKLETGSILAEIALYGVILGRLVGAADASMIIADFTRRITAAIDAFSVGGAARTLPTHRPTADDANDIRAFVAPLRDNPNASLSIRHARLEKKDGERHTLVEYNFDAHALQSVETPIESELIAFAEIPQMLRFPKEGGEIAREVMLFFTQASRGPAKEKGRTPDKAVIPDISKKALPVYFRSSVDDLKQRMVRGDVNPLTSAFVVDALIQRLDEEPKGYVVIAIHAVIPDDDDGE